jgi:hypothetical protein
MKKQKQGQHGCSMDILFQTAQTFAASGPSTEQISLHRMQDLTTAARNTPGI